MSVPLTYEQLSKLGIIAEINRAVLHPRGYCLEVRVSAMLPGLEPPGGFIMRIVDDAPGDDVSNSRIFGPGEIEIVAPRIRRYWKSRKRLAQDRIKALGAEIQPLPELKKPSPKKKRS